ncbi:TetR/AcrR family transcriptional regulator [Williamsia sp. MIQD14]|uniref:TetR/AcrR family transcriptional regulator n=1 Tax=Williamsia sp. MIQD14 TaxID=3425703 RepID=UPI003DA0A270
MPPFPAMSRRERNKQDKLERIATAARELFAERGFAEVTTQHIADRADVGAGTVFLYAKNKGELLLLVQNADYAQSLERGIAAADGVTDTVDAVMSLIRPIVECNRKQIENGRAYQREVVFGDHDEPHHAQALALAVDTEAAITAVLAREGDTSGDPGRAAQAHIVTAIMFLAMALTTNVHRDIEDLLGEIRGQITVLLRR